LPSLPTNSELTCRTASFFPVFSAKKRSSGSWIVTQIEGVRAELPAGRPSDRLSFGLPVTSKDSLPEVRLAPPDNHQPAADRSLSMLPPGARK
jgi:hypothetical protein